MAFAELETLEAFWRAYDDVEKLIRRCEGLIGLKSTLDALDRPETLACIPTSYGAHAYEAIRVGLRSYIAVSAETFWQKAGRDRRTFDGIREIISRKDVQLLVGIFSYSAYAPWRWSTEKMVAAGTHSNEDADFQRWYCGLDRKEARAYFRSKIDRLREVSRRIEAFRADGSLSALKEMRDSRLAHNLTEGQGSKKQVEPISGQVLDEVLSETLRTLQDLYSSVCGVSYDLGSGPINRFEAMAGS